MNYILLDDKKYSQKELQQLFQMFSSPIDWNNPLNIINLSDNANKALDELDDIYRIKLLGLIRKQIEKLPFIFKLHFVFLEWSIRAKNYKAAKQFIENNSIVNYYMISKNELKDYKIEKYFYYCGIIYAVYWDYPEALRYFELASKSDKGHHLKAEIDKQINIIKCRTGQAHNLDDYSKDEDVHLINQSNDVPERDSLKIICRKKDIYSKLPLAQQNGDRWGVKNLEFLTNKLNLFWINEEKDYIQFKKVDKSYDDLNDSLMKRYQLISNMIVK